MFQRKITRISFGIALTIVGLMWAVFILDYFLELDWSKYGLYPKSTSGIIGIFTAPFLHSTDGFSHILNNSLTTLVLSWMLFYHYRTIATKSFLFIYFFTGITMWFFARESYHIGMSGVIYGLTSFLVTSGFVRKNMRVAAISLIVVFLYGSTVWGIFPNQVGVSWEAHSIGLLSGVLIALYFRKSGPQPAKLMYEIQEELEEEYGLETENEYWKEPSKRPDSTNQPKIIVNYTIVPKPIQIEKDPPEEKKT